MEQAGDTFFVYFVKTSESDPLYGANVVVGILVLPQSDSEWTIFPEGSGLLATVSFKVIEQDKGIEKPPSSCGLSLIETFMVDDELAIVSANIEQPSYILLRTNIADINGDYKVDIRDIAVVAQAFGSNPDHPRWNPAADINGDEKVDIRDVAIVASNFGWQMEDP